jgi:hypothetical protein
MNGQLPSQGRLSKTAGLALAIFVFLSTAAAVFLLLEAIFVFVVVYFQIGLRNTDDITGLIVIWYAFIASPIFLICAMLAGYFAFQLVMSRLGWRPQ